MCDLLPFETGYLSNMRENELLDLADELDHMDFWRQEKQVEEAVNAYIETYWKATGVATYMPAKFPVMTSSRLSMTPPSITSTYQHITLNVPRSLPERAARLFAEIQFREQMQPGYDPTDE